MTDIDQQIIAGMTGIDKALWFAGRDARKGITARAVLANLIGVTPQAVCYFNKQGWLPDDRAAIVRDAYGIPLEQLVRPESERKVINVRQADALRRGRDTQARNRG